MFKKVPNKILNSYSKDEDDGQYEDAGPWVHWNTHSKVHKHAPVLNLACKYVLSL